MPTKACYHIGASTSNSYVETSDTKPSFVRFKEGHEIVECNVV
jgi:hypothetical protein